MNHLLRTREIARAELVENLARDLADTCEGMLIHGAGGAWAADEGRPDLAGHFRLGLSRHRELGAVLNAALGRLGEIPAVGPAGFPAAGDAEELLEHALRHDRLLADRLRARRNEVQEWGDRELVRALDRWIAGSDAAADDVEALTSPRAA